MLYIKIPNIIVFIILLLFAQHVIANYSKQYDEDLSNLILVDSKQALIITKERLLQHEISGDVKQQLISILYIAQSLDMLAKYQDVDFMIEKGLQLARKHNNIRFISEFIGFKSYQQATKGDYSQAIMTANKAYQYAIETGDDRLIAGNIALRGEIQLGIENYDLALKDVQEAIEIFEYNNDNKNLSINYNLLAIIYDVLGDYDNAIKYYQESTSYDAIKSPYNQASVLYNMGSAYVAKEDYTQALEHYNKSMDLSLRTKDVFSIAFTNYGIAEVLVLTGDLVQAEEKLSTVFRVFEANEEIVMLINSYLLMAEIKTQNEQFDSALEQLKLAKIKVDIVDAPMVQFNYLLQMVDYFVAQEMWKEAYEHKKKAVTIQSKVDEKKKKKLVSELKIRFNAQFDQEKLELLTKQNTLQKHAIQQEKARQNYLWGLIVLGLMLFVITYTAYLNQRKIKRRLYKLSRTDYLTNVANRRHIMEKLKDLQKLNLSDGETFGLVMIDLDFFKKINDTHGHDIGNEVLIHFANTAKTVLKNIGEVGRIGGEEWLILLPKIGVEEIRIKLNELRNTYGNHASLKIPDDCVLSFSSGALVCNGQYDSYEKMFSDVDKAMYKAKEKGKEQDVFI